MEKSKVRIAVTSGDPDGVGLEISLKAILQKPRSPPSQIFLFRGEEKPPGSVLRLLKSTERTEVRSLEEALDLSGHPKAPFVDIISKLSPAHWVESAAKACLNRSFDALVTAPLSKPLIKSSGLQDLGHTEILKRVSGVSTAHMGFVGKFFSVVLGTGHIPLSQVSSKWTPDSFRQAFAACLELRELLAPKLRRRPVGVLGLNPHAGDSGLIGQEEFSWMASEIQKQAQNSKSALGPLVPDAAFLPQMWTQFSVYLAAYHDQGLIPFKSIHGYGSGVHLTLGLPLKRTSVDHGVAKDLFGKNKADPGSMTEALRFAIKWAGTK